MCVKVSGMCEEVSEEDSVYCERERIGWVSLVCIDCPVDGQREFSFEFGTRFSVQENKLCD